MRNHPKALPKLFPNGQFSSTESWNVQVIVRTHKKEEETLFKECQVNLQRMYTAEIGQL